MVPLFNAVVVVRLGLAFAKEPNFVVKATATVAPILEMEKAMAARILREQLLDVGVQVEQLEEVKEEVQVGQWEEVGQVGQVEQVVRSDAAENDHSAILSTINQCLRLFTL